MKSNVSHILILERERSSSNHQRELFSDEKTKKKEQQQQQLVVHSLSSFSCAFLSLSFFFVTCQRSRSFTFSTPATKSVFVSLFPSIQECNPSNPPSSSRCALNSLSLLNSLLKLSFFTSFVENVLFCLSLPSSLSRFLLPLESRSP